MDEKERGQNWMKRENKKEGNGEKRNMMMSDQK